MTDRGTILAVDDDRIMLRLLAALLQNEGYRVVQAASGEAALEAAAAARFELFLLDIVLPGIDGFELFRRLQAQDGSRDTPAIFLTASTDTDLRVKGLQLGAVDFASKPFQRDELLARVRTHVELFRSRNRIAAQTAELQRTNEQLQLTIRSRDLAEQDRRKAETRLQLAQRLESVGRLAAGIAHEINTPCQYLADNTRFLSESFAQLRRYLDSAERLRAAAAATPALAPEAARLSALAAEVEIGYLGEEIPRTLAQSTDGLDRIRHIVGALKEFAHPPSATRQPTDLNAALRSTIDVTSHEWKYVADLVAELAPDLPPVPAIADELNQAFLHLLVNAAHAVALTTDEGRAARGRIVVRTHTGPTHAIVEISDTGTGIPPEVQAHLFEPFANQPGSARGVGQGLAIVHSVVTRHSGSIEYETSPAKGTTFRILLPLGRPAAALHPAAAAASAP